MRILVVCTANICRSPMAEHLLRRAAEGRGAAVQVLSAGLLEPGRAAAEGSCRAMQPHGIDLSDHVSRRIDAALVDGADLVLTMEVRHVREAAVLAPSRFPRIFTLRELARRGRAVGRRGDRPLDEWLADVGAGRRAADLVPATHLDVPDPYGGPDRGYTEAATELVTLVDEVADLLWGPVAGRHSPTP